VKTENESKAKETENESAARKNDERQKKLMEWIGRFSDYPGFPRNAVMIDGHARVLGQIVHDRTLREVFRFGNPSLPEEEMLAWFKEMRFDPDQNDMEWLFGIVMEYETRYPMPPTIRMHYCTGRREGFVPLDRRMDYGEEA
jgi:hypothetical protein